MDADGNDKDAAFQRDKDGDEEVCILFPIQACMDLSIYLLQIPITTSFNGILCCKVNLHSSYIIENSE